jgi:hypothetical protein
MNVEKQEDRNMRTKLMRKTALSLAIAAAAGALVAHAADLPPYPVKGTVVQVLKRFDNPEGAIFSADGTFVFVSNAAELGMPDKGFHWTEKAGYVSKLAVQRDGTLKMVNEKLITGLSAPLGMAVSTQATRRFPKGTIWLAAGAAPLATADGTHIDDPSRMAPRLLAFNTDGRILGQIKVGLGSVFEKISGAPATLPNAIGFDKEGNLYFADTGIGGAAFKPPVNTNGGVWMILISSIDPLAEGKEATVHFVAMPNGGPDGLEVAWNGVIHTNTVGKAAGMEDPAQGGMYRLTKDDFMHGRLPEPFATGLGALDGLDFVGTVRIDTEIVSTNSVVVTPAFGKPMTLTYDQERKLAGPADVAIRKLADGSWLMVIPELSATSPNNNDNPVTVVKLPADFDRF